MPGVFTANTSKALTDGQRDSLMAAGVPRIYCDRSLVEFTHGQDFAEWAVNQRGFDQIRSGLGFIVNGEDPLDQDLFYVMARALHLVGISVKVTSLVKLVANFNRYDEDSSEFVHADALFITAFNGSGESPLTSWQKHLVQDFISDRMMHGRPVFLHCSISFDHNATWWSREFINRVRRHTATFPEGLK